MNFITVLEMNSIFLKLAHRFNEGPQKIPFLGSNDLNTFNFDLEINQADIKDHIESCHRVTSWRFLAKKSKQMFKILISLQLIRPQGAHLYN